MRIGIDVGGTFNDVVAERGDELVARAGASIAGVTSIIHGTTLATRAVRVSGP